MVNLLLKARRDGAAIAEFYRDSRIISTTSRTSRQHGYTSRQAAATWRNSKRSRAPRRNFTRSAATSRHYPAKASPRISATRCRAAADLRPGIRADLRPGCRPTRRAMYCGRPASIVQRRQLSRRPGASRARLAGCRAALAAAGSSSKRLRFN